MCFRSLGVEAQSLERVRHWNPAWPDVYAIGFSRWLQLLVLSA